MNIKIRLEKEKDHQEVESMTREAFWDTLKLAEEMRFKTIIIFGHPAYYHRFGFVNAERFRITTSDGANFEPFMALELYEGALRGIEGRFYEDDVFKTDPAELETFDRGFPYREKHVTDTQFR